MAEGYSSPCSSVFGEFNRLGRCDRGQLEYLSMSIDPIEELLLGSHNDRMGHKARPNYVAILRGYVSGHAGGQLWRFGSFDEELFRVMNNAREEQRRLALVLRLAKELRKVMVVSLLHRHIHHDAVTILANELDELSARRVGYLGFIDSFDGVIKNHYVQ